jgi:hypothetical protein
MLFRPVERLGKATKLSRVGCEASVLDVRESRLIQSGMASELRLGPVLVGAKFGEQQHARTMT